MWLRFACGSGRAVFAISLHELCWRKPRSPFLGFMQVVWVADRDPGRVPLGLGEALDTGAAVMPNALAVRSGALAVRSGALTSRFL